MSGLLSASVDLDRIFFSSSTRSCQHNRVDELSPLIMAYPDAWIYQFGPEGIQRVAYEDTEHYQITRSFMRDHKIMMKRLLRREDELDLGY